jgi:hypothetical protein
MLQTKTTATRKNARRPNENSRSARHEQHENARRSNASIKKRENASSGHPLLRTRAWEVDRRLRMPAGIRQEARAEEERSASVTVLQVHRHEDRMRGNSYTTRVTIPSPIRRTYRNARRKVRRDQPPPVKNSLFAPQEGPMAVVREDLGLLTGAILKEDRLLEPTTTL